MNKTKIKNFSIWARRNLIEVVAYRMRFLGIDESGIKPEMDGSTDDLKLYDMGTSKPAEVAKYDIQKRINLTNHIKEYQEKSDYKTAYENTVEEIAYTWFNRLIAIRFMEVNDYLPSGVRVLSSKSGKSEPDIVTKAEEVASDQDFDISSEEIWKLRDDNQLDELFRIMFKEQCKKLHKILPELFSNSKDDYSELLLPISFIDKDSFICHLVADIDEDDFNIAKEGQVEIIGWLYQYYNSEKKDAVFKAMSEKVKVSKENIAAATQLFTPDWIVRYMVENSLGRLYIDKRRTEGVYADGRGLDELSWEEYEEQRQNTEKYIAEEMGWKYYLPEATQTQEVRKQLEELQVQRRELEVEKIRFIDPCMGSGHILVCAFEVLMQIYLARGYTERDAAQNIVRNNLWGLDLDKRAYQLAYFAVMMKARQYDKRLWYRIENNEFDAHLYHLSHFQDLPNFKYANLDEPIKSFVEQFDNADTYGSLITVQADDEIDKALDEFQGTLDLTFGHMEHLMQLYKILSQRYDVVCTNPPYMGTSNANDVLKGYIEKKFPDSKSDLFAVFIEKCSQFAKSNGYYAMITQHAWMFLSSYEKLRTKLQTKTTINMAHLGARAFDEIGGEVVQTTAFVITNSHVLNYYGVYERLVDGSNENEKCSLFLDGTHKYIANASVFKKIPGNPINYWLSENFIALLSQKEKIGQKYDSGSGLSTSDNDRFLRFFWEVANDRIASGKDDNKKWYLFHKGGEYRKWYGNLYYVVNWENDGQEIKYWVTHNPKDPNTTSWSRRIFNTHLYFLEGITWSVISSGNISFRAIDTNAMISNAAGGIFGFSSTNDRDNFMAALNTKIWTKVFSTINPTLNYSSGIIQKAPCPTTVSNELASECIRISKEDWDSFETSWDFKEHPFVKWSKELWDATAIGATMQHYYGGHPKVSCPLELCYLLWQGECNDRRAKLKANEEELNRIFIEIYGLQDELTPEVEDKDITVRPADLQRDMRSFVSYAVGCMFGRYSLDREGLVFAGGDFDKVYWKHKGQAALDENGEPIGGGYAGISLADYCYPRFWSEHGEPYNTKLLSFAPDADNCIPITEEQFFEDDIVTQFADFVKAVFGEEELEKNLRFVADNLGIKGNGTAREKIRQYFLKEFYKDHCKVYQKRPIYWLFDTGKKNGFKALCYIHRWTVNTVGDVRIDYMHKLQRLYRNEIIRLKENIDAGEEIAKSQKRLEKITNQLQETEEYDAKIGIVVAARAEIDLDDGVKVNYDKVQVGSDGKHYQILAKI